MNLPDISSFTEITYGPAFHVSPLRGRSYPVTNCHLTPEGLTFTEVPEVSEFNTHTIAFHSIVNGGPWVTFLDEDGQILAGLGHPDPV